MCETHDPTGEPDAVNPPVRFGERRLETEPWRGVRHRHCESRRQQLPPSAYRYRASRRLYPFSATDPSRWSSPVIDSTVTCKICSLSVFSFTMSASAVSCLPLPRLRRGQARVCLDALREKPIDQSRNLKTGFVSRSMLLFGSFLGIASPYPG